MHLIPLLSLISTTPTLHALSTPPKLHTGVEHLTPSPPDIYMDTTRNDNTINALKNTITENPKLATTTFITTLALMGFILQGDWKQRKKRAKSYKHLKEVLEGGKTPTIELTGAEVDDFSDYKKAQRKQLKGMGSAFNHLIVLDCGVKMSQAVSMIDMLGDLNILESYDQNVLLAGALRQHTDKEYGGPFPRFLSQVEASGLSHCKNHLDSHVMPYARSYSIVEDGCSLNSFKANDDIFFVLSLLHDDDYLKQLDSFKLSVKFDENVPNGWNYDELLHVTAYSAQDSQSAGGMKAGGRTWLVLHRATPHALTFLAPEYKSQTDDALPVPMSFVSRRMTCRITQAFDDEKKTISTDCASTMEAQASSQSP